MDMAFALAESVLLMNPIKPIIFLVVVGAWAAVVSALDKDMEYFFLQRKMWNAVEMAAGRRCANLPRESHCHEAHRAGHSPFRLRQGGTDVDHNFCREEAVFPCGTGTSRRD